MYDTCTQSIQLLCMCIEHADTLSIEREREREIERERGVIQMALLGDDLRTRVSLCI